MLAQVPSRQHFLGVAPVSCSTLILPFLRTHQNTGTLLYPVALLPSVLGCLVTVSTFSQVRPKGFTLRGEFATSSAMGKYTCATNANGFRDR